MSEMKVEAEVPGITDVVAGLDDETLLRSMLTAAAGVFKRDTLTDAHPRLIVARDRAAALMAAAPDLAEAAQTILRDCDSWLFVNGDEEPFAINAGELRALHAALKKAGVIL